MARNPTSRPRSKTKRLRQRIDLLLEMGFDAVALLDVIGNEPAQGPSAYLDAGWRARQSARAFQPILEARLTDDIPAAHFCWAVGSVFDRDERFSGGGGLLTVRRGLPNPLLQEGNADALAKRNDHASERGQDAGNDSGTPVLPGVLHRLPGLRPPALP